MNLKSPPAFDNGVDHNFTNGYDDNRVSETQANGHVTLHHEGSFDEIEA